VTGIVRAGHAFIGAPALSSFSLMASIMAIAVGCAAKLKPQEADTGVYAIANAAIRDAPLRPHPRKKNTTPTKIIFWWALS
jgi:hypothetical protein